MTPQLETLLSSYHQELEPIPDNAPLFGKIAGFYYNLGQYEQALSACQTALKLQPGLAEARQILENVLHVLERTPEEVGIAPSPIERWITLNANSLNRAEDPLGEMAEGRFWGIEIEQVFSKAELVRILDRIESLRHEWIQVFPGAKMGWPFINPNITNDEYFQRGKSWRDQLNNIFLMGFETRLESILTPMAGGRSVELLSEDRDRVHIPTTIRIYYPDRGGIDPHAESLVFREDTPTGIRLKSIKERTSDSFNFIIMLDPPEDGGELIAYDLLWEETPKMWQKEETTFSLEKANFLKRFRQRAIALESGNMVIFHGMHLWHQVANVIGSKNRVVAGGFISLSKDQREIYYWV